MYTVFVNHLDQEALKTRSACSLMASLRYMGSSYLGDWNVDEWGTYTLFSVPLVCIMYCPTRVSKSALWDTQWRNVASNGNQMYVEGSK